jgi:antitoxin Phd
MIRMAASKARKDFSGTLNRVAYGGERIVLRRHQKDVVAVVSLDDLALLQALEDRADLDAARAALAEEGSIPWEKIKADLGL